MCWAAMMTWPARRRSPRSSARCRASARLAPLRSWSAPRSPPSAPPAPPATAANPAPALPDGDWGPAAAAVSGDPHLVLVDAFLDGVPGGVAGRLGGQAEARAG